MKLSKWCKQQGICYHTGFRWFHQGLIPNATQTATGTILINETQDIILPLKIVTYSRTSNLNKEKLQEQVDRCQQYCLAKGYSITKQYYEVASGMNDNRAQFWKMLDEQPTLIIIENKNHLTRFGFKYLEKLLERLGCKIEVINQDQEDETDLIKDLVSIITSFCCRLYGIRRGQNKTKKIKEVLNDND